MVHKFEFQIDVWYLETGLTQQKDPSMQMSTVLYSRESVTVLRVRVLQAVEQAHDVDTLVFSRKKMEGGWTRIPMIASATPISLWLEAETVIKVEVHKY